MKSTPTGHAAARDFIVRFMNSNPMEQPWLPSGEAARRLAVSSQTLKRWADPTYGSCCLEEGLHFRRGPLPNSPIKWHIPLIEQVIRERSLQTRPSEFPAPKSTPMEVVLP